MKLVHFTLQDQFHFGMITDANEFIDLDTACRDYYGVNPIKGADPSRFRDMQGFFGGGADSVQLTKKIITYIDRRRAAGWTPRAATGARFLFKPEEGVKLLAPIVRGSKIYCLASNSRSHLTEQGKPLPKHPYAFSRYFNSLVGPSENLILSSAGKFPDVELELAVVIGQRGKHIPVEKAMEFVAGYTIALDMGYRDLQYPADLPVDWVMGKGFDATMAVGPWVVRRKRSATSTRSRWSSRQEEPFGRRATPPTMSSGFRRSSPTSPRASPSNRGTSSPSAASAAFRASSSARSRAS